MCCVCVSAGLSLAMLELSEGLEAVLELMYAHVRVVVFIVLFSLYLGLCFWVSALWRAMGLVLRST